MDGEVVTAMRTAACSALSVQLLAREDASVLAVLGTGVQARAHAEAVKRVRPIREVRIAGRDSDRVAGRSPASSARSPRRRTRMRSRAPTSCARAPIRRSRSSAGRGSIRERT